MAAVTIGSSITGFGDSYIPSLSDAANIQNALKSLYFGATGAANTGNGIYGALYTLYQGNPTLAGSTILSKTNAVTLASTAHALQIGPSSSANLAISPAIIQGRSNGSAATLTINPLGGDITLGTTGSTTTISGNLVINGTQTTINSTTLTVDDKLIELGDVASPSNITADGGGVLLKGGITDGDKTLTWSSTGSNWSSSENLSLATGKTYKINNVNIVSGTGSALVIGENASTSLSLGANGGTATVLNPTVTLTNATALNMNGANPSISTTSTGTASIFNSNATTVNIGSGATTAVSIGGNGGTASILNPTVTLTNATTLNMNGASPSIVTSQTTGTAALFNTNIPNLNIGGAATALTIGATTGTATLRNPTITLSNATALNINGASPAIVTSQTSGTAAVFNTNVPNLNIGGAATAIAIGNASGTTTVSGNLTMATAGKQLLLANGNTATAPLKFSGTTTVGFPNWSAGNMEYDGKAFRATPGTSGSAIISTPYIYILQSDLALSTSTTTAFGNYISLPVGFYEFEVTIPFQFTYAVSATALSLGIKGTAVSDGIYFLQEHFSNTGALTNLLLAADVATGTVTSGRVQTNWRQQSTSQSLNTSNLVTQIDSLSTGSRYGVYRIRGWVNITTAGTFYPAATFSGGGSGSIKTGAYAKVTPMSDGGSGFWQQQT